MRSRTTTTTDLTRCWANQGVQQGCVAATVVLAVLSSCGRIWTSGLWEHRTSPVQMHGGSMEALDAAREGHMPGPRAPAAKAPVQMQGDSIEAVNATRKAYMPGPRAPANDLERRRSTIPEYRPEKDLVFFSHIHKTSGTSLSAVLEEIFPTSAVVPTSHRSKKLEVEELQGHDEAWWDPFQVMFSHDAPNITDTIGIPATKTPRLLLVVRNPLLHKASIFFESVCRYGLHIKNGTIDQEEATLARLTGRPADEQHSFCRDAELWVGSEQYCMSYRNFEARWLSYGAAEGHPCIKPNPRSNVWIKGNGDKDGKCGILRALGKDAAVWEEYFDRTADAAIRKLEGALWVGVTERMEQSACLLFLTLGMREAEVPQHRLKIPRPISVWHQRAKDKAAVYEKADWRVFDAANDILDLRLWEARERLKDAGQEEREKLGGHCFDLLSASGGGGSGGL